MGVDTFHDELNRFFCQIFCQNEKPQYYLPNNSVSVERKNADFLKCANGKRVNFKSNRSFT